MKSKQVLDVQQMQHLQELGLEIKDSMLYWIVFKVGNEKNFVTTKECAMEIIDESCGMLPAYTLQDVLDALPKETKYHGEEYSLMLEKDSVAYVNYVGEAQIQSVICQGKVINKAIPLIDYAYSMLCWAIENGYVETNKKRIRQ